MSKSVISNVCECYVCKTIYNIHKHHCFGGARRKSSEHYGAWVYLCCRHHNMSAAGVHNDSVLDHKLKALAQEKLEKNGMSREDFISIFGKNWR